MDDSALALATDFKSRDYPAAGKTTIRRSPDRQGKETLGKLSPNPPAPAAHEGFMDDLGPEKSLEAPASEGPTYRSGKSPSSEIGSMEAKAPRTEHGISVETGSTGIAQQSRSDVLIADGRRHTSFKGKRASPTAESVFRKTPQPGNVPGGGTEMASTHEQAPGAFQRELSGAGNDEITTQRLTTEKSEHLNEQAKQKLEPSNTVEQTASSQATASVVVTGQSQATPWGPPIFWRQAKGALSNSIQRQVSPAGIRATSHASRLRSEAKELEAETFPSAISRKVDAPSGLDAAGVVAGGHTSGNPMRTEPVEDGSFRAASSAPHEGRAAEGLASIAEGASPDQGGRQIQRHLESIHEVIQRTYLQTSREAPGFSDQAATVGKIVGGDGTQNLRQLHSQVSTVYRKITPIAHQTAPSITVFPPAGRLLQTNYLEKRQISHQSFGRSELVATQIVGLHNGRIAGSAAKTTTISADTRTSPSSAEPQDPSITWPFDAGGPTVGPQPGEGHASMSDSVRAPVNRRVTAFSAGVAEARGRSAGGWQFPLTADTTHRIWRRVEAALVQREPGQGRIVSNSNLNLVATSAAIAGAGPGNQMTAGPSGVLNRGQAPQALQSGEINQLANRVYELLVRRLAGEKLQRGL